MTCLKLYAMVTVSWVGLAAGTALAQEQQPQNNADSELTRRVLEALKKDQSQSPAQPAQPQPSGEKKSPAAPAAENKPAPTSAPAKPQTGSKLPGFSEAVPPPAVSKPTAQPSDPKKTELPRPEPRVIVIPKDTVPIPGAVTPNPQPPAAPAGEGKTYTIQSGDTFSSIALHFYGDESKWTAIAKANPLVDPTRLKVGKVIKIPDLSASQKERTAEIEQLQKEVNQPDAKEGKFIYVEPGDNLTTISRRIYGKSSLWRTIYEANSDQLPSPDDLEVGMKLRIPPKPGEKSSTQGAEKPTAPPATAPGASEGSAPSVPAQPPGAIPATPPANAPTNPDGTRG